MSEIDEIKKMCDDLRMKLNELKERYQQVKELELEVKELELKYPDDCIEDDNELEKEPEAECDEWLYDEWMGA